jgi:uncharacterized membrane protein YidH (DUF202 family)
MTTTQRGESEASQSYNVDDRTWIHVIARVGITSRGVIYLLLAYLAFDIAQHGSAPAQTSSTGALEEVRGRPGGAALMVALALGLACYGLWRLLDALTQRRGAAKRVSSFVIAVLYFGLCAQAVRLISGQASSNSASSNPVPLVAKVLRWSGGPTIVEVTGVVLVGAGAVLAIWGIGHHFEKDLALERTGRRTHQLVKVLGGMGDAARAFLVILVGIYLIKAGAASNPTQAKSVDESLKALVHHPYGAIAIGLVALGLLCFAFYSFFDARLRRL